MEKTPIDFISQIRESNVVSFEFVSYELMTSEDPQGGLFEYLTLELKEPIERVTGSHRVYDPANRNNGIAIFVDDVHEVRIKMTDLEAHKDEFEWEADENGKITGIGTYKGKMTLDVSKNSQNVWLTPVRLAKQAKEFFKNKDTERYNDLFKRSKEPRK